MICCKAFCTTVYLTLITWMCFVFDRYLYVLVAGMEAKHTNKPEAVDIYFHQQNDVCMLRLFEAFLESAPQLTLQLYIMMYTDSANWLTGHCMQQILMCKLDFKCANSSINYKLISTRIQVKLNFIHLAVS